MRKLAYLLLVSVVAGLVPAYAGTVAPADAKKHVGEDATVCGTVASVHFAAGSKGSPTFINLDKPYPNHVFTILIWGDDLPKFTSNPVTWQGKKACAAGTITSYQGVAEIVAKSQIQITLNKNKQSLPVVAKH
jgi:hypothetical protein